MKEKKVKTFPKGYHKYNEKNSKSLVVFLFLETFVRFALAREEKMNTKNHSFNFFLADVKKLALSVVPFSFSTVLFQVSYDSGDARVCRNLVIGIESIGICFLSTDDR